MITEGEPHHVCLFAQILPPGKDDMHGTACEELSAVLKTSEVFHGMCGLSSPIFARLHSDRRELGIFHTRKGLVAVHVGPWRPDHHI